jgi:glycosyltransferase involved in cell wall biosynthesis
MNNTHIKLAVVIPCYRVKKHIIHVLEQIGSEVHTIYIVDDCCPEQSGRYALQHSKDPRLILIKNAQNMGVGGAVMAGYQRAILDEATIIIKLDGDEQMDPQLIPQLISPILLGYADYTKGNRFFNLEKLRKMPNIRLFGNALLSLLSKLSSGYWDIFDPTNGYTAIHADVARHLPFEKISRRYFFESDMLFRLNTLRAVVIDVPMDANYGEEESNLKVSKIVAEFLVKHGRNFFKRLFYNYYLRNMSIASIELPLGLILVSFGTIFGATEWVSHAHLHIPTPTGTIMIAALSSLMGLQFIMAFLNYDISSVCKYPLHLRFVQAKPVPATQPLVLDETCPADEQPNTAVIK